MADDVPRVSKRGKPSKFDRTVRDRIMALAGAGQTETQICRAIGISQSTFTVWKNKVGIGNIEGADFRGFTDSLLEAKCIADDMVECALLDNAINRNNITAQIFWLKNRRGKKWRERYEMQVEPIEDMEFNDEQEDQQITEKETEELTPEDENEF